MLQLKSKTAKLKNRRVILTEKTDAEGYYILFKKLSEKGEKDGDVCQSIVIDNKVTKTCLHLSREALYVLYKLIEDRFLEELQTKKQN
jgi:hypothetical protein